MCESTAYLSEEGQEKLLLENVEILEQEDGMIRLVNLFGEEKRLKGRVKSLSLVDHKIIVEGG
jgi:predicted RNA-binding protein